MIDLNEPVDERAKDLIIRRLAKAEEEAREIIATETETLRRLDSRRADALLEAKLAGLDTDVTELDAEIAKTMKAIDAARYIINIAAARRTQEERAEEAEGLRQRFEAVKRLLDRRLELAAAMDKSASAYGRAEREFTDLCGEVWSMLGADRDGSFPSTSATSAERGIGPARRRMKAAGAAWAAPAGRYEPTTPSAANAVAEANRGLLEHLKPRWAPAPTTESST